jgi:predicted  nucleic acid-binding Zn-ribbon protein
MSEQLQKAYQDADEATTRAREAIDAATEAAESAQQARTNYETSVSELRQRIKSQEEKTGYKLPQGR